MWGKIIGLIADTTLKVYQYELKATELFNKILSNISFGNFILLNNPSLSIRQEWLEWYNKAIQAYGYYILLPCIAKVYGDEITKNPILYEYLMGWGDFYTIWNRIQTEDEYDTSNLEGIAKAFRDFFSPIVKGFMEFTGTFSAWARDLLNSAGYAIWDIAKKKKFDTRALIENIIQRYRGIGNKMRVVNIPPEFYYQQRPTLDFDVVILFSHIHAFMTYWKILNQDIQAQKDSPLYKGITADIEIDGEKYKTVKLGELMKINFCISKEDIEKYKGKPLDIEVGGVTSE